MTGCTIRLIINNNNYYYNLYYFFIYLHASQLAKTRFRRRNSLCGEVYISTKRRVIDAVSQIIQ